MPSGPTRFFGILYIMTSRTILLIDGENFLHKVKDVLREAKVPVKRVNLSRINLKLLLEKSLGMHAYSKGVFYGAKLHFNEETAQKSKELILQQRYLKTELGKQGFEFVTGGNVRTQKIGNKTIFKEKGVDVRIAVDMVALAADKKAETIILCSSDSDLQPAIQEVRKRKVKVMYLGFGHNPNKGLTYTTDKTVLLRDSEVLEACGF